MASAPKYRHTHTNALGQVVDIYFDKEDYSGPVTPIKLGPGVFKRRDSDPDSDEMTPQRPWVAEIPIPASAIDLMDDVFSDASRWWVRKVVDGSLDRYGIISKDERERGEDLIPEDSYLVAYDGLGWLANEQFVADDGTIDTLLDLGSQPWIYWVLFILNKLGFEMDVATAAEWYTPSMNQSQSPLHQEYVPPGCYLSTEHAPPSCLYVLKDLLKGYNAFIYMEGGKWHIYQRELMAQPSFGRTIYPHDYFDGGPSYSIDTYLPRYELTNNKLIKEAPTSPLRRGYAAAQVHHLHGAVASIVENPGFSRRYEESGAGGWEAGGAAVIKAKDIGRQADGEIGHNQAAYLPAIHSLLGLTVDNQLDLGDDHWTTKKPHQAESGTEFIVAPRAFLELTTAGRAAEDGVDLFQINLLITATEEDETVWYLHHDPETEASVWSSSKKRCSMYVAPEEWQTPIVRTPALPAKARVSVRLESVVEFGPLGYDYRTRGIWYDNILIFPAPEDEDVSTARTEVVDYYDRAGGIMRDAIEVHHGTGPSTAHEAATVDANGDLLTDWKVGPYTVEPDSGLTKAQLLAHQVLVQTRVGNTVKKMGFLKQVPVSCVGTLLIDGKLFLPTHIEVDEETNEPKATLVELRLDAFDSDFDTLQDDGAQFLVPNTGQGVQHLIRRQRDAAADLAIRAALTVTSDDIGPGIINEIPVEVSKALQTHQVDLEKNKEIIIAGLRAGSWQMTLAADHLPGGDRLKIEPFDLGSNFIPKGSGVHSSEQEKANTSTLTRDATYNIIQQNSLTLLNESLTSQSVDSIRVSALSEQVLSGQFVTLYRKDGSIAAEFWIVHNAPKGAKRLSISARKPEFDEVFGASGAVISRTHTNQVDVLITAEDGSAVRRSDRAEQLESTANSSRFTRFVTRADFNELEKKLEEVTSGPVQQLTDTLGDPVLVNGEPIYFARKLRDIIPAHETGIAVNGSAIAQLDDQISIIVAGVDPETTNLATINVRVGDNEAEIADHTLVLTNNGLTSGTDIIQFATDNQAAINQHAGIFTSNGLTASSTLAQDVVNLGDEVDDNYAVTLSLQTIIQNNGLTSGTDVYQFATDNQAAINQHAGIFTSNGLTASSTLAQDVVNLGDDVDAHYVITQNLDSIIGLNGLTSGTSIASRVTAAENDLVIQNAITDNNGLTTSTAITSRVDTIGARQVVQASHVGGGVYQLAGLDLEAGSSGSIAKIYGGQIQLDGNTTVLGSFTVFGSNVHITAATVFDGDVNINGLLNGVGGTFTGDLTGSNMNLTGTLYMTDGVDTFYVNSDGDCVFRQAYFTFVNTSTIYMPSPFAPGSYGGTIDASGFDLTITSFNGVALAPGTGSWVTINGANVIVAGSGFANELANHSGNASGDVALSNGIVCTNLNAEKVGGWAKVDLVKRNSGPTSNSSTAMPNYTKTIVLEDSSANTITLYGT